MREFQTVARHLARLALVIADDIGANAAFHDWTVGRPGVVALAVGEAAKVGLFVAAVSNGDAA